MTKVTKIWLAVATFLVVVGLIIFAAVMSLNNWKFDKMITKNYETNTYDISQEFSNISIDTDTADIIFALSDDGKCRVECYEAVKEKHSVTVEEDTLVIKFISEKYWYDYIAINIGTPKIKVYLPKVEYDLLYINEDIGDIEIPKDLKFESTDISLSTGNVSFLASVSGLLKIKTSTGNICVKDISAGVLALSVSTGRIMVSDIICEDSIDINVTTGKANITNLNCKNIVSAGTTGNISLNNVIVAEKISINRSTGDVEFDGCDAAEIFVETDTGDVVGEILSEKVFLVKTDTGKVQVPKTISGGKFEVITDTGDVEITIKDL